MRFPFRAAWLFALAARAAAGQSPGQHLWDREPSYWDLARAVTIQKELPPTNPRPEWSWPTTATPAVNLSTPRLRVSLWGPPEQLTLSMGKTDVWDRRSDQREKPLTLAEVRAGAFSPLNADQKGAPQGPGYMLPDGGRGERYQSWRKIYPAPKPVGQVIVRAPEFKGSAPPEAMVRCDDGAARVSLRAGPAALDLVYLAMMARNIVAVGIKGRDLSGALSLRLYRHQDTTGTGIAAPESGSDGRFFWIRQRLPAEKTFPGGFEYVLMGIAPRGSSTETESPKAGLGTPMSVSEADRKGQFGKHIPDYGPLNSAVGAAATANLPAPREASGAFFLTVVTSAESAAPIEEAQRRLLEAEGLGLDALIRENAAWYKALYDRRENGRIFGGDPEWTRREIHRVFRSWTTPDFSNDWPTNPDPPRFESDELYAHLEGDSSPWHGLPCLNEVYFTPHAVLNRLDRLSYYPALVNHWRAAGRKNAREVFGLPGMFSPAHGYLPPIKADEYFHTISTWEFCMEIPAQVMKAVWDIWDYGGDTQYLATTVYPALKDLAVFYAAYVTLGNDSRYHVVPTMSAEHWGWTYQFEKNRNSASALSLIAWTLKTAAAASELLGVDGGSRRLWMRTAERMAPYPAWPSPDGPVFSDVAGVNPLGVPYNFFAGVTPTLLADQIHLDSSPSEIEVMSRTAQTIGGWANGAVFHLLGLFPDRVKGVPASLLFPARADDPIDNAAELLDVASKEPERLLNSRSGRIHLFPCVPPNATVAFRGFQARGGFMVSAEMVNGRTQYAQITARRDTECRILNPWRGRPAAVRRESDNRSIPLKRGAVEISFPARAGESYILEAR